MSLASTVPQQATCIRSTNTTTRISLLVSLSTILSPMSDSTLGPNRLIVAISFSNRLLSISLGETDEFEPQTSGDTNNTKDQHSDNQANKAQASNDHETRSMSTNNRTLVDGGTDSQSMALTAKRSSKQLPNMRDQIVARDSRTFSSSSRHGAGSEIVANRHSINADDDSALAHSTSNGNRPLRLDLGGTLRDTSRMSLVSASGKSAALDRSLTVVSSSDRAPGAGRQGTTGRAYLASDNERHKRKLAKARERRATLILGLIMAAFICSWLPFFTFYVLRALCHACRDYISPRFEAFIFWMGYCNSAINPIIYTIFNRDFRKAFRKILFKCL